ncbi:MAG: putative ATP-binding cassette transporter [Oleiphilaceae bacterium]|jgi:putative ATP-binding cassette transporter
MISIIADIIGSLGTENFVPAYSFLSFSLIVLGIISFGVFSQYVLLKLGTTVVYQVQRTILARILGTDYEVIERNGNHRIMAAMKDDVTSISRGITVLPNFIYSSVSVLLCLGYMVYTAWQLFFLVAFVLAVIVLSTRFVLGYAFKHQESLREDLDLFFSHLNALANGGKELHINHNRKRHFYSLVMLPLFNRIREKTIKISTAFIGLDSFSGTIVMFLIGAIVYSSLTFFPGFDAQVVVTFTLVILYMVDPLTNVIEIADEVNLVRVSLKKIERLKLVDSSVFLSSIDSPPLPNLKWKELELKGVSFEHINQSEKDAFRFKLGPISAKFEAGQITYITGGNGSGKSTFAKIISGLYSSQSGSIFAGDSEVGSEKEMSVDQYKSSISVVFSDTFVFPHILDDRGVLVEDEIIHEHIERLKLAKRVKIRNGDFKIKNLSTGQIKRLALLQSFVNDAHVCIYDEWAADQDPTFKKYFYLNILPELKRRGKIVIVITHDDHYFDCADQLLKLDNGQLVRIK